MSNLPEQSPGSTEANRCRTFGDHAERFVQGSRTQKCVTGIDHIGIAFALADLRYLKAALIRSPYAEEQQGSSARRIFRAHRSHSLCKGKDSWVVSVSTTGSHLHGAYLLKWRPHLSLCLHRFVKFMSTSIEFVDPQA